MKKIILLVLITLIFNTVTNGQYAERTSAYNYLRNGKLDKAKEAIDKACLHEKTMNDPKTLYYAGQIYSELYFSENEFYKNLDPYALEKAYNFLTNIEEKDNNHYITNNQSFISLFSRIKSEYLAQQNEKKITHTTKQGETISSIAKKYGVSTKTITSSNRDMLFFHNLKENDTIIPLNNGMTFKLPLLKSTIKEATDINPTLTASNNNTSNNQLDKKLENNSYALTTNELNQLIEKVKNRCKGLVYNDYYYPSNYDGEWWNLEKKLFYISTRNPVVFYFYTNQAQENLKLIKTLGLKLNSLSQDNKSVSDHGIKHEFTYYYFNPLIYGISTVNKNDNTEEAVMKANLELIQLVLTRDYSINEKQNLEKSNYQYNNWILNDNETKCYNKYGKIPFSNGADSKQRDKNKTIYSGYSLHDIEQKLQYEGQDFELLFNAKYEKNYSKTKEVLLRLSLYYEQEETYRARGLNEPVKDVNGNNKRDKYGTVIVEKTYSMQTRTKEINCGSINILLSKKEVKYNQKIRIVKKDGKIEIFVNNVLRGIATISDSKSTNIKLSGNHIGISEIMIKPILSKSSIQKYENDILIINNNINLIKTFYSDLEKAISVGETWTSYFTLIKSRLNTHNATGDRTGTSTNDYERAKGFVSLHPEYSNSDVLKEYLNIGDSFENYKSVLASNLGSKQKYEQLSKLDIKDKDLWNEREQEKKILFAQIRNDINIKIDSICRVSTSPGNTISKLVVLNSNLDYTDREASGSIEVKNTISIQIENESKRIANSNSSISNKINNLNSFLKDLDEFSKSTQGYSKGQKELRNLMNKTISTTANMNYNSVERKEPLHVEKSYQIEKPIFGDARLVEYTYTWGGQTYNSVTGYEMGGTIKNTSQSTIKVKVYSTGAIKRSNDLIDLGAIAHDLGADLDMYKFGKDQQVFTIAPGKTVNYHLAGRCTGNVNMKVSFDVFEVGSVKCKQ